MRKLSMCHDSVAKLVPASTEKILIDRARALIVCSASFFLEAEVEMLVY